MQRVGTLEAYRSHPIGRYLCGPGFAIWWASVTWNGITFWGRPDEEQIRIVIRALEAEFRPNVRPHASLIDVRRLAGVDLGAFTALLRWARARREPLGRIVTGQAFLRPDGLAGATVAGFPSVLDPAYPARVFTDPVEAIGWLGVEEEIDVLDELEDVYVKASGGSAFVAAVRAHLEESAGAPTLHDAARAFGLSPRVFQRQLGEARTTFKSEQSAARIRVAKTLLLETNYDLKRIAIEVGCASLQSFSALFHKSTGESPSQWRSRQRPDEFPLRAASRSRTSRR